MGTYLDAALIYSHGRNSLSITICTCYLSHIHTRIYATTNLLLENKKHQQTPYGITTYGPTTYHHQDALADSNARCHNTSTPSTPLHPYYYKETIAVAQQSTKLWTITIPEREQFYSRPRAYPVQYRRMARHNPHLAIDGSTQNTTPRSQHHRSMSIKPQGYLIIMFIPKNTRRNQRTSKDSKCSTRVQIRTKSILNEHSKGDIYQHKLSRSS